MLKIILKYIGIAIIMYPIGLVLVILENTSINNIWLFTLLSDVLVNCILCVLEIRQKKKE